jgi:hypothetical protein
MKTHFPGPPGRGLAALCALAAAAAVALPAASQTLPPSPRMVFKCEQAGRVVYTDQPCSGAQKSELLRVHAPPPEAGVQLYSSVAAPVDSQQMALTERPPRVAGTPRAECPHLAQRIALVEAEEQRATSQNIRMIQERLGVQRNRYNELGCSPYWVTYAKPGSAPGPYVNAAAGARPNPRVGHADAGA